MRFRPVHVFLVLLLVWSFLSTGFFVSRWNVSGWKLIGDFFLSLFKADLSPDFLALVIKASGVTFAYALWSTFLALILGLVFGVLSSEVFWTSLKKYPREETGRLQKPWLFVRGMLAFPRAIHEVIWGLLMVHLFGLTPLTAILAIALPFGALTAKVYSEILDECPRGQLHALLHTGIGPLRAILYSIFPQAFKSLLSYGTYRFECSIRSAAVLGIVGAGGLGYEILLSLQSLRFEQIWTLMAALLLLTAGTDFLSRELRLGFDAPIRLDLTNFSKNDASGEWSRRGHSRGYFLRPSIWLGGLTLGLVVSAGLVIQSFESLRQTSVLSRTWDFFRQSFPPEVSKPFLVSLGKASLDTLAMSVVAISLAGFLAMLIAALARPVPTESSGASSFSQISRFFFRGAMRMVLLFSRALPPPVWALIFLWMFLPGMTPGILAIGIHQFGILGKLLWETVENEDPRPFLALRTAGVSERKAFFYAVLPSAFPKFLAYLFYRWEVTTREMVLVGMVGAGGLGRILTESLSSFDYRAVSATLVSLILIAFFVDFLSRSVRNARLQSSRATR